MSSGCLAGDYTWYITQPRRERTNIHHPRQLGPLLLSPDDDDVDGDEDDDDDDDDACELEGQWGKHFQAQLPILQVLLSPRHRQLTILRSNVSIFRKFAV